MAATDGDTVACESEAEFCLAIDLEQMAGCATSCATMDRADPIGRLSEQ
jgi:hypothetical protein